MGTFGGAKPIVTDGLSFMIDATNKQSFTSGSTSINDVVGDLDGTLFNGPVMGDNFSITLDGTNDSIGVDADSRWGLGENTTINFWFKKLSYSGWILSFKKASWIGWWFDANSSGVFGFSGQNGSNDTSPNFNTTLINQWYNYVLVVDRDNSLWKTYKNGVFIGSDTINHGSATGTLSVYDRLYVGSRGRVGDLYSNMEFGSLSFYDRVLSSEEILQNYNALKGRFGL